MLRTGSLAACQPFAKQRLVRALRLLSAEAGGRGARHGRAAQVIELVGLHRDVACPTSRRLTRPASRPRLGPEELQAAGQVTQAPPLVVCLNQGLRVWGRIWVFARTRYRDEPRPSSRCYNVFVGTFIVTAWCVLAFFSFPVYRTAVAWFANFSWLFAYRHAIFLKFGF